MTVAGSHGNPTAINAGRILRRNVWIVVLTTLIVTALSIVFSLRQAPSYQASAQVLLNYQNLATGFAGVQDLRAQGQDPVRAAATQTQIAMSPAVARRVVEKADVAGLTTGGFLSAAAVTAGSNSDTLNFQVTYSEPSLAADLANLHARAYIASRQQLDTSALAAARKVLQQRIDALRGTPGSDPALLTPLLAREQELQTLEALQTANASLLRPASGAVQVQPKPVRNAVLGVILGFMLGIGLAFARDAFDTRVRSADDVGDELGVPLLARLPAPRKNLRTTNTLVMMADPRGHQSEAFRMLRSNLEFVNLDRGARTILVTSALEKEGKSTTVSNLAVTLARAGKRVALVDLDLRRPAIRQFFGIDAAHPGVTNVVLGQETIEQALVEVFHSEAGGGVDYMDHPPSNGNGSHADEGADGVLAVLVAGASPPDPGEFVGSPRLSRLLAELAVRFDVVLIDTPPLLSVGDAMTLSAHVDGMIAVARLELLKRPVLQELSRALATCPSLKLGYIVTGAESEPGYEGTGYQYYDRADGYDVNLPLPTQSETKV